MTNMRSALPRKIFLQASKSRFLFLFFLMLLLILTSFSQVRKYVGISTIRATLPEPQVPGSCEGRWIFVYDLDPEFNREFVQNCSSFKKNVDICPYTENGGMGKSFSYEPNVFVDGVWYNTWQFSLEMYFHERLLRYPCLAPTEESANAFYVPFYAGMDLANHVSHPSLKKYREKTHMELLDWLRHQYFFLRNGGFDHFITLGHIAFDFRRPKGDSLGSRMLLQPDFQNMVKLTIERDGSTPIYSNNEIAVPYPSYFHPRDISDIESLTKWSAREAQRSVLVSIAGVRRKQGQGGLKEKLMMDCEQDARCTVLICEGHEGVNQSDLSTRSYSFLPISGHSLHESCSFPSIVLDIFHRSVFCLQPPGESPSRRSFIDSLIAGCIPVIFKRNSAWSQYPSFLPEDGDAYSVLIPIPEVRRKNVVQILGNISKRKIASMRAQIQELLPRILYAHVNRKYPLNDLSDGSVFTRPDAFDIAVNEVLSLVRKNVAQA
ncbi:unnamed protein product [Calypogeia fissa]